MKLLFLDIDGVISIGGGELDTCCLRNLSTICLATDCKIIISSDWRYDREKMQLIRDVLESYKVPVLGETLTLSKFNIRTGVWKITPRWIEISETLRIMRRQGLLILKYAIVDDKNSAMLEDDPRSFFQTSYATQGLNVETMIKIIEYLNSPAK